MLEQNSYTCSTLGDVSNAMGFCERVVNYNPSLPAPTGAPMSVPDLVRQQEAAAQKMYVMHLSGMGLEYWDHQTPWTDSECIKSVWRMVCYTYFPKAPADCASGSSTTYLVRLIFFSSLAVETLFAD